MTILCAIGNFIMFFILYNLLIKYINTHHMFALLLLSIPLYKCEIRLREVK